MPDSKSARILELADQCVQCGLCLPACPTYALDRNEAESPRGRIALAAALARDSELPPAQVRTPLDHCLGCLNCERVCPAQVRFGELLVATRALTGPAPQRPRLLLAVVRHPGWLRIARRLATWSGLARLAPALGRHLPRASTLRAALALAAGARPGRGRIPARAHGVDQRMHLALFPGCAAAVEDRQAEQAAVDLLQAAGYRVTVLPAFCCGALDAHDGREDAAGRAAGHVRAAWHACGASALVTVTPGCLETLRRVLPDTSVTDPYALLLERIDRLDFAPLEQRVAVHQPCTERNVACSSAALQALLARIPGLETVTLEAGCCGAAGSHMLTFPERAERLREPLLRQLDALAPQACLSSNIGCRLHLAAGLRLQRNPLPTLHPLSLLHRQLVPRSPA